MGKKRALEKTEKLRQRHEKLMRAHGDSDTTSLQCSACGMLGHMKSNMHCPKYNESKGQVIRRGSAVIKLDDSTNQTKMTITKHSKKQAREEENKVVAGGNVEIQGKAVKITLRSAALTSPQKPTKKRSKTPEPPKPRKRRRRKLDDRGIISNVLTYLRKNPYSEFFRNKVKIEAYETYIKEPMSLTEIER